MYSVDQILKGLRNPQMLAWELNRAYFSSINETDFNDEGIDIFEADWDTLVVLDACRADEFEENADLPGVTESRRSKASMTREWVRANFLKRELHDTVYVTAINQIQHFPEGLQPELHDLIWPQREDALISVGEMRTLPPNVITEHATRAHKKYPNKRIIVHYGQPHQPYLGPTSEKLSWGGGDFHQNITQSDATHQDIIEAYRETLDIVLDEVNSLIDDVEGRIVISADHGEMLGERQRPVPIKHYGHPAGIYLDELVAVPWHVYESGKRRIIEPDEPTTVGRPNQEELKSHLRDMGYV